MDKLIFNIVSLEHMIYIICLGMLLLCSVVYVIYVLFIERNKRK